MAYFENPDCLVAEDPAPDLPRSKADLIAAAKAMHPTGILVITEPEYQSIRREVGLGYRWQGRRIYIR